MKSEIILKMINENQIEELKQKLIEEITISNSTNKNITKNIIALSKKVAKEMKKSRPYVAGTYIKDGKQCLCNGYYACIYDSVTDGTVEREDESRTFDLEQLMPKYINEDELFEIDVNKLNNVYKVAKATSNKDSVQVYKIKGYIFNIEYIINVLGTFEEPKCYVLDHMLFIKGLNGRGLIMGFRGNLDGKNVILEIE